MDKRERARELADEFAAKNDLTGWFEALYAEAEGDNEKIPWADMKPNPFLVDYSAKIGLKGEGRKALVVGCGLGDDAKYMSDLGFEVTAFDISESAIKWAGRVYPGIDFHQADLFDPPKEWSSAFDYVLEIYTIQPLPLAIRPQAIDAVAKFVKKGGRLLAIMRGRDDDEAVSEMPWPLSKKDLSQFEKSGLSLIHFEDFFDDGEEPCRRFIAEYLRS